MTRQRDINPWRIGPDGLLTEMIAWAVKDATSARDPDVRQDAVEWLQDEHGGLVWACGWLGVDPEWVRRMANLV